MSNLRNFQLLCVIICFMDFVHHLTFKDNKGLTEQCILETRSVPNLRIKITLTPFQLGQIGKGAAVTLPFRPKRVGVNHIF